MDAASAKFQSTQADFKWDVLQSVVNEHDIQSGTVYFERHGDSTSMAAYIKQPAEKTVFFNGSTLTLLQPEIKQETLFSAGSNRGQYESFLTLGFGGSGKDLQNNWTVTCQGMEADRRNPDGKAGLEAEAAERGEYVLARDRVDRSGTLARPEADLLRAVGRQSHRNVHRASSTTTKISADIFKPKDKGYNVIRK